MLFIVKGQVYFHFIYLFICLFIFLKDGRVFEDIDCLTKPGVEECNLVGTCINDVEGFYIVNLLIVFLGFILFFYLKKMLTQVQNVDVSLWKVNLDDEVDLSGL